MILYLKRHGGSGISLPGKHTLCYTAHVADCRFNHQERAHVNCVKNTIFIIIEAARMLVDLPV